MADKKLSIADIVFLIILCWLLTIFGCTSQARQMSQMDSNHYVAQAQLQGYPCPGCGFPIPDKDVSSNIRTENKCPNCGKIFFGKPVVELESNESQKKHYQGPKVFGRGYYSDIKYENKINHSVKNTWKVSPDGSSGSMSQTFIRTYEHNRDGEYGTLIGPGARYGYGGY